MIKLTRVAWIFVLAVLVLSSCQNPTEAGMEIQLQEIPNLKHAISFRIKTNQISTEGL
jgi:hypothetical protein